MEQESIQQMVHLLERKNSYLDDFQKLNKEELNRLQQGDFNNLEAFYYDRELLLNGMDRIDSELRQYSIDQFQDVCEKSKQIILTLLRAKKKSILNIVSQDMKIHDELNASAEAFEKEKIA